MNNILITGGAGFIGSNLAELLLKQKKHVVCVDNFELGNLKNLEHVLENERFVIYQEDVNDFNKLSDIMEKHQIDMVFHLAANSDIQRSAAEPEVDFLNTFQTTYNVLKGMREHGIKKMFFASTSAVYGERPDEILREDLGGLLPISYYGGAKLASEAFISSYSKMDGIDVTIFRFANVIGPNLTHGVIFDFVKKLKKNPQKLQILGDGTQRKPYIYIDDLIEAILMITQGEDTGINIYNAGVDSSTTVHNIADMVCRKMNLTEVKYCFTEGNRGWKGDVPTFRYDLSKIHAKGWRAKHTSDEAVWETLCRIDI